MLAVIDKPPVEAKSTPSAGRRGIGMITQPPRVIRDPEFARRLESAMDQHPHAPPRHHGRLSWLKNELAKKPYEIDVSVETTRKWLAGESRPRPKKMERLAELLQVDPAWLAMGIDPDLSPRERKVRNATIDGVVNVVAGIIQMDGGHPAFPEENDKQAARDNVDLYAIIRGANYALRVALGHQDDKRLRFVVPTRYENVIVIGVIRTGLSFEFYEVPLETIADGNRRGGSIEVSVPLAKRDSLLKRIESFSDRL